jgi:hypothetical protein
MKSGNLNFLEPSGPLQACNGTDLPLPFYRGCEWVELYISSPYMPSRRAQWQLLNFLTLWHSKTRTWLVYLGDLKQSVGGHILTCRLRSMWIWLSTRCGWSHVANKMLISQICLKRNSFFECFYTYHKLWLNVHWPGNSGGRSSQNNIPKPPLLQPLILLGGRGELFLSCMMFTRCTAPPS